MTESRSRGVGHRLKATVSRRRAKPEDHPPPTAGSVQRPQPEQTDNPHHGERSAEPRVGESSGHDGLPSGDEFTENETPETGAVFNAAAHRAHTQAMLAQLIIGGVLLLYAFSLVPLMLNWWTAETFKEVALALGAPLGLATAVAGFFFGSDNR